MGGRGEGQDQDRHGATEARRKSCFAKLTERRGGPATPGERRAGAGRNERAPHARRAFSFLPASARRRPPQGGRHGPHPASAFPAPPRSPREKPLGERLFSVSPSLRVGFDLAVVFERFGWLDAQRSQCRTGAREESDHQHETRQPEGEPHFLGRTRAGE